MVNISVRYHSEGSMKLNACILILAHMFYLYFYFINYIQTIIIYTYTDWQYGYGANPFFTPLAGSPSIPLPIPFHLLGIPLSVWCDPVHLGHRLLVN